MGDESAGSRPTEVDPKPTDENGKDRKKAPSKPSNGTSDHFWLNRIYPEAHGVFQPTAAVDPASADVLVTLDTNALLLPYKLTSGDLGDLARVYSTIAAEKRLFLPEQVPREFIKNRDAKLAEMVKTLEDRTSALEGWSAPVSPLFLEGFEEHEGLAEASKAYKETMRTYAGRLKSLTRHMRGWRGTDPVMSLYASIFDADHVVGPGVSEDDVIARLEFGIRHKVPPGYKDAAKDDQGVGDVLIWLSLLALGEKHKRDLVFVTGEEKADWFVRAGGRRLYPRPELIYEYRRRSGGRSLRLSSLQELLEEMKAPETLVADVGVAETSANNAIQAASGSTVDFLASTAHTRIRSSELRFAGGGPSRPMGRETFDYSTHDGQLRIERDGQTFTLAFSKASDTSIHLLRRGTTRRIGRVKHPASSERLSMDVVDTTSSHYTVHTGEGFLVENQDTAVLAGRILRITDDTRGADRDEVSFDYLISPPGEDIFMP